MSVNVYTGGKLKKISGENITSQKILSAIGYKPAKADTVENHVNNTTIHVTEEDKAYWNDKNYHTLQGAPNIVEDESATLYIADITGNVIAQINEDGVYTTDVLLTTSKKSVLNAINKLENLTYNDLVSKPDIWEEEDGSAEFIIVDEPGNIILKVDNSGLKVKNINDIDFSNFVQSINTFLGELHPIARTGEFDDLENSPIEREVDVDEGSETLKIIDNEGNISLEIDSEATKIDTLKVNTINLKGTNVETELNLKATKNEVESLATALENHKNDNTKEDIYHVTAEEKQYWNKKSEFSGDYNDLENKPIEREDSVEDGTETFKIVDEAGQKALEIDSEATKVQNLQVFGTLKLDGADLGTTIQDINTAIGNRYTKTEADNKFETQTAAQEKYNDATKYTDDEIKELIGSAADDYKTLGGIQSKLEGEIQKIETVISDHKENKNEDIYHVTQKEKDHWNDKSFGSITDSPLTEDGTGVFKIVDKDGNISLQVDKDSTKVAHLEVNGKSYEETIGNLIATDEELTEALSNHISTKGNAITFGHVQLTDNVSLGTGETEGEETIEIPDNTKGIAVTPRALADIASELQTNIFDVEAKLENTISENNNNLLNGVSEDFNSLKKIEDLISGINMSQNQESIQIVDDKQQIAFQVDGEATKVDNLIANKILLGDKDLSKLPGEKVEGKDFGESGIAGEGAEIFNDYTNNKAIGIYSHAEGSGTTAVGKYSHAEGANTIAEELTSHAEGSLTKATSKFWGGAHAEGVLTRANGDGAHAEGISAIASGDGAHAEGNATIAKGVSSHAEGTDTQAKGGYSHAEGYYTIATGNAQHVQGAYNIEDTNNTYAHIVGNGIYDDEEHKGIRSNAHTLDWDGNTWYQGNLYLGGTSQNENLASIEATVNNISLKTVDGEPLTINKEKVSTSNLEVKNIAISNEIKIGNFVLTPYENGVIWDWEEGE